VASRVRTSAAAVLLAAPTVLAFFSGGFFAESRLWAALVVWAALAGLALAVPEPLPRSRPALACLGGLAGLTAWVALSISWAPVKDPALGDAERLALYLGFLLCAAAVLRGRALARALEPALAGGALVVAAYALATRLLPGLVPSHHGVRAGTRLDQPLTYWNGLGALMAIGLVLALRLASDTQRDTRLRVAGAAATPAFSLALYLTLSRGALAAAAVGVAVLATLARDRETARSALVVVAGGVALAAIASRFPAVDSIKGDREGQGLAVLALLLVTAAVIAAIQWRLISGDGVRGGRLRASGVAAVVVAISLVAATVVVAPSSVEQAAPPREKRSGDVVARDASRLRSLQTNRLKYWDVALHAFADSPLRGTGTRGFATLWLEKRSITETATDTHSLYVETLVELGLVGALLLAAFLGGAGVAAARVYRSGPRGRTLVTGWIAAGAVFVVHAGVDWDWEMPAVSLIFLALAGAALAAAERPAAA
jgi:O-antigen ligase